MHRPFLPVAALAALTVAAPLVLAGCAPVQMQPPVKYECGQAMTDLPLTATNQPAPESWQPTCTPSGNKP